MKTLKIFMAVILMAVTGNTFAQTLTSNNAASLPPEQVNQIQSDLINGMVSFVESVRPFYVKGDTYQSFKYKVLVGDQTTAIKTALPTTPAITPQGEAMLKKAYVYLSKGYSATQIAKVDNGKTIGEALVYTYNDQKNNSKSSALNADVALFGGNQSALDNNPITKSQKRTCKWYQIACHAENVINWISGHSENIIAAAQTIATILSFFK